jgi:hypothetical protein
VVALVYTGAMERCTLELGRTELAHLLEGQWEFSEPAAILAGLSAESACREVSGCPHTIAQLVRHLHFWQQRRLEFARGGDPLLPTGFELGVDDFETVSQEDWPALRDAFLASFADLLACAEQPELVRREPVADRNVGYMLASHALHNAYHLGQIVLLRRLMGDWHPVYPAP